MNYKLIVAFCKNQGIGLNQSIPWYFPNDLKRFSKITRGIGNNAVIMGRKTMESLPSQYLPKRDNFILSKCLKLDKIIKGSRIKSFSSPEEIKEFCSTKYYDTIWIIGGEQIYNLFMKNGCVNEMEITYIDKNYDCDTFFPDYTNQFTLASEEKVIEEDEEDDKSEKVDVNIFYRKYTRKI
jgi:dihydrofolate reductase